MFIYTFVYTYVIDPAKMHVNRYQGGGARRHCLDIRFVRWLYNFNKIVKNPVIKLCCVLCYVVCCVLCVVCCVLCVVCCVLCAVCCALCVVCSDISWLVCDVLLVDCWVLCVVCCAMLCMLLCKQIPQ